MQDTDRAAVAREEVLRFLDEAHREGTPELFRLTGAQYSYLSGRAQATYPAPPAPVTVTVTNTWTQQPSGYFTDHIGNATPFSDEWATALHRIAADARRIAELERESNGIDAATVLNVAAVVYGDDFPPAWQTTLASTVAGIKDERDKTNARIAELEKDRSLLRACVNNQLGNITRLIAERDEARRALEEARRDIQAQVNSNASLHDIASDLRKERDAAEARAEKLEAASTVSNDDVVAVMEEAYGTNGCDINATAMALAREVVALRHPVAGRETVERVAKAIDEASRSYSLRAMARAALKAAGFTLEAGA